MSLTCDACRRTMFEAVPRQSTIRSFYPPVASDRTYQVTNYPDISCRLVSATFRDERDGGRLYQVCGRCAERMVTDSTPATADDTSTTGEPPTRLDTIG